MRVSGHGLSIDAPVAWEARVFRREGARPVLHLATFALSPADGDFGAAATGRMRPGDAFAALVEYQASATLVPGAGLFARTGVPVPLSAHDFHPRRLQVTRSGHLGTQRFFTEGGRPLSLYAVIWPSAPLAAHLPALNAALESLIVEPLRER